MADFRYYAKWRTPGSGRDGKAFGLNTAGMITYPMNEQVKEAIELCLKNMQYPISFIDDYARPGYEVYCETFKTAEVLPYFFTYKQSVGSLNPSPNNRSFMMTHVPSTAGWVNSNNMNNVATAPSTVWHEQFETWLGIEPRMSYTQKTRLNGDKKLGFKPLMSGSNPGIVAYNQSDLYKPWTFDDYTSNFGQVAEGVDRFTGYLHTSKIDGTVSTISVSEIENIDDLYSPNTTKEQIAASSYGVQNPDLNVAKWSVFMANNLEGSYSAESPRNGYMSKIVDNATTSSTSYNIGGLYFAVKTTMPFANDDGTVDTYDDAEEYWIFNAISLLANSFESSNPGTNTGSYGIGENTYGDDFDACIERLNIALPTMDATGESNNGVIIPPFPYFIWKYTDFFNDQDTKCITFTYSDGYSLPQPLKTGLALATNDVKNFERFYQYAVGIPVTTTYNEAKNLNVSEWEDRPDPPSPPTPPEEYEPGSGGQIGGMTGGGSGIGGTDEGDISDAITPSSTATGGGRLTNQWLMNGSGVEGLRECLVNDNIWDAVKTLFKSDYKEGLISLVQFPFNIYSLSESFGTTKTVKILNQDMDFTGITHFCIGYEMPRSVTTSIQWGEFDIKERFGSFLDYDRTSFMLYMPFIGRINLPASVIMGRRIKIIYDVDYTDGSCLGTVWVTNNRNKWDNIEAAGWFPYISQSGQIGTVIPISSSDGLQKTQQKLKSIIGLGAGAITAATTGGAAAPLAAGMIGGTALQAADALTNAPDYNPGGAVDSNHTWSVTTDCVLTCVFPEVNMTANHGKIAGYATNLYDKLQNQTGFTACDMFKTDGIPCTEAEANEIKRILAEGVVINEQ